MSRSRDRIRFRIRLAGAAEVPGMRHPPQVTTNMIFRDPQRGGHLNLNTICSNLLDERANSKMISCGRNEDSIAPG